MSYLNSETAWTEEITQNTKSKSYNFYTAGKFIDRDINFTVNSKEGSLSLGSIPISVAPTFNNVKEDENGYKISVNTIKTFTPTIIQGWIDASDTGTITVTGSSYIPEAIWSNNFSEGSKEDNNPQIITSEGYTGNKFLSKVKLTTGQKFSIEVPNGNNTDTVTFIFQVDSNNNVIIT